MARAAGSAPVGSPLPMPSSPTTTKDLPLRPPLLFFFASVLPDGCNLIGCPEECQGLFRSHSRSGADKENHQVSTGVEPVDAVLVTCAQADPRAFTALYQRYLGPVYRYCFVRLGNREAAEDAAGEVFLKALAALSDYRDGIFAAWLFRIAHNVVADVHRRRRVTEPIEAAGEPPDLTPTPEDTTLVRAERQALRLALARLPDEQRTVVQLQLAGWSHQDIASALGKTPAAVKMLRFRALGRLRTLLTSELGSDPKGGHR